MICVILNAKNLSYSWWAKAANTSVHVFNRVYLRPLMNKTAYELWKGRKPKLSYFHVFESRCYIIRNREYLSKFDARGVLGYFTNNYAFRVINKCIGIVMELVNVMVEDVEQCKTNPRMSIDIKDENIAKITEPHCDAHTSNNYHI